MSETPNKRRSERIAYACEVEVYGAGTGRIAARIRVLSLRGAFVETASPYAVGTKLNLRFILPGGALVIAAEVVHMVAEGMGVRFLALTRAQHAAIQGVLTGPPKA